MPAPWRYRKPGGKAAKRKPTMRVPPIAKAFFTDIFGLKPVAIIKDGIEYKPEQ